MPSADVWSFNIFPYLSLKQVAQCQRACKLLNKAGNDYFPLTKYRSINAACRDVLDSTRCSYLSHEILPKPLPLQKSQVEAFLRSLDQDPFVDVAIDELQCILQVAIKVQLNQFVHDKVRQFFQRYLGHDDRKNRMEDWHRVLQSQVSGSWFSHCGHYRNMMDHTLGCCFKYGNFEMASIIIENRLYITDQHSLQLWNMLAAYESGDSLESRRNSLIKSAFKESRDERGELVIIGIATGDSKTLVNAISMYNQHTSYQIVMTSGLMESIRRMDASCIETLVEVYEVLRPSLKLSSYFTIASSICWSPISICPDVLLNLFRLSNQVETSEEKRLPSSTLLSDLITAGRIHIVTEILKHSVNPSSEFIEDLFHISIEHGLLELCRFLFEECSHLIDLSDSQVSMGMLKCAARSRVPKMVRFIKSLMAHVEPTFEVVNELVREGLESHLAVLFSELVVKNSCSLSELGIQLQYGTNYHCLTPFIKFYQPTKNRFLPTEWMTVREYLLSKTGANFDAMYYFHQEWKASFTLNVLKGWFVDYSCAGVCLDFELDALAYVIKETKPDILLKFVEKQTKNIRGHKANNQLTRFQKLLILSSSLSKNQNDLLECLPFFIDEYVLERFLQRCFDPEWIKSNDFMARVLMMLRCCQRISAFECVTKLLTAERWLALNIQGMNLCMKKSQNDFDELVALDFLNWQDTWPAMPGDKKLLLEQAVEQKSGKLFYEWLEMLEKTSMILPHA